MSDRKHCDQCDGTQPRNGDSNGIAEWIVVTAQSTYNPPLRNMSSSDARSLHGDYCSLACLLDRMATIDPAIRLIRDSAL